MIEVGPAHTSGDTLAYVPDARTIYTGDILFIGGTPIVWAGPLSNWIAACDLMLGMDVDVVVPGHGPVTDKAGVASVHDYLSFVDDAAGRMQASGVDTWEATREIAAEIKARPDFRDARRVRPHRCQRRHRVSPPRPGVRIAQHRRAVPQDGAPRERRLDTSSRGSSSTIGM